VVPHALIGLVTCKLGKRSRLFELSSKACPLGACREGLITLFCSRFSQGFWLMTLRTIALLAAALAQHDPPLLTLLVVGCAHWLHAMHPCRHYRPGPTESKGTAFGLFNLASGLFMQFASVMARLLTRTKR
jgi:hypothetical protein